MSTATYVYCLVANSVRPRLRRSLKRLPDGGPVRVVAVDAALWLAVCDVPLSRYGESPLKKRLGDLDWVASVAIAHESTAEAFLSADAVLPMKLFTIFETDESARGHIAQNRRTLDKLVARVTRREEWGVRVAVQKAPGRSASRAVVSGKRAEPSGSSYLLRKKAQRDEVLHRARRAHLVAADLFETLAAYAAEAKRRPATELAAGGGPLVLDAAFLVPRSGSTKLKNAAARQARVLSDEGFAVSLTGPWPPYSFMQD
jgi:gas vesicle protein GvpL/GvpF